MEHRRIIHPSPVAGWWRIECSCGWKERLNATGHAVMDRRRLEVAFVAHVPEDRREVYVLVDQRPVPVEEGELPAGNLIMPIARPCTLIRWWESDGIYYGQVSGIDERDLIRTLPIGEIRTEDGRVFRTE